MAAFSQTAYHLDQMSMEALNRGLIVMRQSPDSITVSWRLLNEDPQYITFDLFAGNHSLIRNTSKTFVNLPAKDFDFSQPNVFRLTAHTDKAAPKRLQEGTYTLPANAPVGYLDIPLNKPADAGLGTPAQCRYSANDCTMADMDGDGQMEIIVKWDPSNSHDNSHQGYTGHVLVDCYSLTPLPDKQQADSALQNFLWRIDLGPNIRAGAHYTQIMAYDLDGDGKAEVVMKTGDGTVDALGNVIGDASANHVNERGHVYKGPEYLTVFCGETGKALYTTDYVPERGAPGLWGDLKQNRSDRYLACVGYFGNTRTVKKNGKKTEERLPSVVMCRGYYTRSTLVAWDWDGKQLTQRWFFDSYEGAELKDKGDKWVVEKPGPWGDFSSQGNHSLIVADVDSDGWDEIIYGSCTIDHNGKGLYSTKLGHGDAMHLGPMLPDNDNLYVWAWAKSNMIRRSMSEHNDPNNTADNVAPYIDFKTFIQGKYMTGDGTSDQAKDNIQKATLQQIFDDLSSWAPVASQDRTVYKQIFKMIEDGTIPIPTDSSGNEEMLPLLIPEKHFRTAAVSGLMDGEQLAMHDRQLLGGFNLSKFGKDPLHPTFGNQSDFFKNHQAAIHARIISYLDNMVQSQLATSKSSTIKGINAALLEMDPTNCEVRTVMGTDMLVSKELLNNPSVQAMVNGLNQPNATHQRTAMNKEIREMLGVNTGW